MKTTRLKQGLLGAAIAMIMLGSASLAQAGTLTYYCVASAISNSVTNVGARFSMTVDEAYPEYACDTGCLNEWNDYLKGNYEKYYKLDTQVIAYEKLSAAKRAYNDNKAFARKMKQSFHHASDFSCSGD